MPAQTPAHRNALYTVDNRAGARLAALRVEIAARQAHLRQLRERIGNANRSYSAGTQREILAASEAAIRDLMAECGELSRHE